MIMMTSHETRTQAEPMPFSYGATYLCRRKKMVVSLGYCEHCAECLVADINSRQLEQHHDVYA